jgi:CBS domain containing-hemolysin-like protein
MVHSVEELRVLLTSMQEAGVVPPTEAQIARRAFAFGELTAGSLMTPRTDVDAIAVDTPLEGILNIAASTRHTRLPVYDGSLDNIVGILHVRDLFKHRHDRPDRFDIRALLRAPLMVPEQKHAAELLDIMRARHRHIAIVIDEYGGMAGLLTLDNLLEALVGAIDSAPQAEARLEADGSILVDGLMRVDEFLEMAATRVDPELTNGVETVGGLIGAIVGRFPEVGEIVTVGRRAVRIEARDGLRIATVRVLP